MNSHIITVVRHFIKGTELARESKSLGLNSRNPGFPSEISEFMALKVLSRKWNIPEKKFIVGKSADIILDNKKIEVKCFSSDAPVSFGSNQSWSYLILIDAKKYVNDSYFVYLVPHCNNSSVIKNIKINKSESFGDFYGTRIRPRIKPDNLLLQLGTNKQLIAKGGMTDLIGKL